jgi:hypothetical protein
MCRLQIGAGRGSEHVDIVRVADEAVRRATSSAFAAQRRLQSLAFSLDRLADTRFSRLQIAGECRPRALQQPQNLLHLRVCFFEQSCTAAALNLSGFHSRHLPLNPA